MDWSDETAAAEARRGNQAAFRLLVERHSGPLFRLAFRICGNEQDAEDLVQETFLRAFRQLRRFDGRSSFGTWLYRICINCALDLLRARKNRLEPSIIDSIASPRPGPEQLTRSSELASLLKPAMEQLSDTERVAFVLRHFEGCGIGEIARVLGVEDNAAKQSVFRAVQKLRRALAPAWGVMQ